MNVFLPSCKEQQVQTILEKLRLSETIFVVKEQYNVILLKLMCRFISITVIVLLILLLYYYY